MKLIIGLGNPGPHYIKSRHNFGFLALDYFKNEAGVFSDWQAQEKFKALISEGRLAQEKLILAKPQTLMNLSGQTVRALTDYYQVAPENIWVIHDDIDLPLGVLRISQNASAGGHKGIHSIMENLGSRNFVRFRLGIHPLGRTFLTIFFKKLISTKKFVLQKFAKTEKAQAKEMIKKASQAIQVALKEGVVAAQNQFN